MNLPDTTLTYGVLDEDHRVVPVDLETWVAWFKTNGRRVALDEVRPYRVSTVFLGINYAFLGPPLWFETMIFKGDSLSNLYMDRYETWDEAVLGHAEAIEIAKIGKFDDQS